LHVRSRTVASTDSIGFVVRLCDQCSAGKSVKRQESFAVLPQEGHSQDSAGRSTMQDADRMAGIAEIP